MLASTSVRAAIEATSGIAPPHNGTTGRWSSGRLRVVASETSIFLEQEVVNSLSLHARPQAFYGHSSCSCMFFRLLKAIRFEYSTRSLRTDRPDENAQLPRMQ